MFKTDPQLNPQQVDAGLKWITRDGIAAQAMLTCTSGAFLIAFILKLGASNLHVGLLAAIGPLAQLLQIPAIWLIQRVRNRKLVCFTAAGLSRLMWLPVALAAFVLPARAGLTVVLGALVVSSGLGAVAGCAWNSWMRDVVPQNIMGQFFSRRMRLALGFGIVLSLAAAGFLDGWRRLWPERVVESYGVLFLVGLVAGLIGLSFMARIPEVTMAAMSRGNGLLGQLLGPFRDRNFRQLLFFMASWSFAINLAAPFFMVYMLRRLGLTIGQVIGLTVLSQVVNVMFLKIWGRFTDRFSNKSVLAICGPFLVMAILGWTFTTMPERHVLTWPLLIALHVVMGFSSAGVALAGGNIGLKLAPQGEATAYLATHTVFTALASGLAPVLGGQCADFFAARNLEWTMRYTSPAGQWSLPTLSLQQWDFLFVLAFVFGLYSLHRLALVREVGEVEERVVMRELGLEMKLQVRTMSSLAGLRHMVSFPVVLLNQVTGRRFANHAAPVDAD